MFFRIPRTAWKVISWSPVAVVVAQHSIAVKTVTGRSMQPALNPEPCIWRDIVVFDRFFVHGMKRVERGDIVSLRSPVNPDEMIVKRVVALQGDTVQTLPPYPQQEVKIPEGHVWIEGDEPFWTLDSNTWGPIPRALIDARLVFVLCPLNRFGPLKSSAATLRKYDAPRGPKNSDPKWKKELARIERDKWHGERAQR